MAPPTQELSASYYLDKAKVILQDHRQRLTKAVLCCSALNDEDTARHATLGAAIYILALWPNRDMDSRHYCCTGEQISIKKPLISET